MGFDRCKGKMPSTPDNKNMDPETKLRYNNERTTQVLEDTNLHSKSPDIRRIPKALEHLRSYALEMAYIRPLRQTEPLKTFRRRMYRTLCTMAQAGRAQREMRITQLHPRQDWKQVWENLHDTWAPDPLKAIWYKV
jgi:hypothetical protein